MAIDPAAAGPDGRETPLRFESGELRPGLCRDWRSDAVGRRWALMCRRPRLVARSLRGRGGLSVRVAGNRVLIRLRLPWRRFAYSLAGLDAGVEGTRRRGSPAIAVRRMEPHAAVEAFRRGELDEAPVPQGEIRAVAADPVLRPALRVRELLGVDIVRLDRSIPWELRRVLWLTVPRGEYLGVITDLAAPVAYGVLPGGEAPTAADVRAARGRAQGVVGSVELATDARRPDLEEAAEVVWADWRQLGLRVERSHLAGTARFLRLVARYPHPEALFTALGYAPRSSLTKLDRRLRDEALVIPIARVTEARLVNPRVRGWAMDELGRVDYSRVALEPGP